TRSLRKCNQAYIERHEILTRAGGTLSAPGGTRCLATGNREVRGGRRQRCPACRRVRARRDRSCSRPAPGDTRRREGTRRCPQTVPKPRTQAHAPSTSNGQLGLADGAGSGSIREVCFPAADRRYSATSAAGTKGRSSPVLVWSDCRRQPGRLEPDIHCKPGGVQTRTHANAMVVEGSRARPVGPN